MTNVNEPPIITMAREAAASNFGRNVVVPKAARNAWRELHVRPELLNERDSGDRVYRISPAQGRKIMHVWDTWLRVEWESFGDAS